MNKGVKTVTTPKTQSGSKLGLMIWAAINKIYGLVCYKIFEIGETVDGTRYKILLVETYAPAAKEHYESMKDENVPEHFKRLILVEDNAGPHFTEECSEVFEKGEHAEYMRGLVWRDRKAMDDINTAIEKVNAATAKSKKKTPLMAYGWSPHSPDLNPIELLWRWMKHKLMEIMPEGTLDERKQQIIELFASVECNAYCRGLCNYFEMFIKKCVEQKGELVRDKPLKEEWIKKCREEDIFTTPNPKPRRGVAVNMPIAH